MYTQSTKTATSISRCSDGNGVLCCSNFENCQGSTLIPTAFNEKMNIIHQIFQFLISYPVYLRTGVTAHSVYNAQPFYSEVSHVYVVNYIEKQIETLQFIQKVRTIIRKYNRTSVREMEIIRKRPTRPYTFISVSCFGAKYLLKSSQFSKLERIQKKFFFLYFTYRSNQKYTR